MRPNLNKDLPPLPKEDPPKLSQDVPQTQPSTRFTVTHVALKPPASTWQRPRPQTPPGPVEGPLSVTSSRPATPQGPGEGPLTATSSQPPTPFAGEKLEAVDTPRPPQFTLTHKPLQPPASTWQRPRPPTPHPKDEQRPTLYRTPSWPRELLERTDKRIKLAARAYAYVRELLATPMDDLD